MEHDGWLHTWHSCGGITSALPTPLLACRLWSAAACCRFSVGQLAGRQGLQILFTAARASSLKESDSPPRRAALQSACGAIHPPGRVITQTPNGETAEFSHRRELRHPRLLPTSGLIRSSKTSSSALRANLSKRQILRLGQEVGYCRLPTAFPLPSPPRFQLGGFFANPLPGPLHVTKLGVGLADAEADDVTPVELGMG